MGRSSHCRRAAVARTGQWSIHQPDDRPSSSLHLHYRLYVFINYPSRCIYRLNWTVHLLRLNWGGGGGGEGGETERDWICGGGGGERSRRKRFFLRGGGGEGEREKVVQEWPRGTTFNGREINQSKPIIRLHPWGSVNRTGGWDGVGAGDAGSEFSVSVTQTLKKRRG